METNKAKPQGPYNQLKFVEYTKWPNGGKRVDAIFILEDGVTEVLIAQIFTTYDKNENRWSHFTKDVSGNEITLPTATEYQQKKYLKDNSRRLMEEVLEQQRAQNISKQEIEANPNNAIREVTDIRENKRGAKGKER